jgi:hypothetical protein
MYEPHLCNDYIKGLDAFIDFAKKDMLDNIRGNLKDRRRRLEGGEGVNRSQSKFPQELGLYPEINPMPLSSDSAKTG